MRCNSHSKGLHYKQFHEPSACTECRNPTYMDGDVLCIDCSNGFNECSLCRAALKGNRDQRLVAAFRSPAAVAIRAARVQVRMNFESKRGAVNADLALDCADSVAKLEVLLEPHRLACTRACQPHRDALDAFDENLEEEQSQLSALQRASVSKSRQQAHELCDKRCEPHLEKFEKNTRVLIASHRQTIAPYLATARNRRVKLEQEMATRLRNLEHEMCTLLNHSTNRWFIAGKAVVRFVKTLLRR